MGGAVGDALGSIGDAASGVVNSVAPYGGLIGGALGGPMGAVAGSALGSALGGGAGQNVAGGALSSALRGGGVQTAGAPDYMALARQQAAGSRTNQQGPFGSINYTENPNGTWTQTNTYDPQVEQAMRSQYGLANSQNQALQSAYNSGMFNNMGKIDQSLLPKAPINAGTTAYDAIMSRLNPQLKREQEGLDQKLANQGITLGSDAYTRAMNLQGQRQNDLELQAASQGISLDQAARQQALGEQVTLNNQPLNYFNALRGGSQVSAPSFGNISGSGANLLGAGQAGYQANLNATNAQNAYNNNMMGGLFGIGGQVLSNPAAMNQISGLFGGGNTGNVDWSGMGNVDQWWL